ncbi:Uncharacterized J domain-containing protein C4H3.01 [Taphrina deformans PYCC 5710]|uniref:Uncharacterized J domain-containing protein C4H3.01 n=1 Tax=Taphrina deformans (strain PYCC 5710 / ATCC 11124 / CBS 356.35 / IMI 108563 / JCM 9778 / NBRC 8474) TaxID=1097556 RepID=R4X8S7_TAPDE|nr:Uncharacterized J domain-containing protein C4H3.01 [Taphrina deformans PYCC 5710]|eukprot:CCG82048.1 Uncharacterized J domain-containing protein C4H3.01 [Taphrina deformans PYCC 5710]
MVVVRLYQPGEWTQINCKSCQTKLEYLNELSKTSQFTCPKCSHITDLDPSIQTSGEKDITYYEIMEISPQATSAEIKKAYHKRAAKIHPDKTGGTTTAAFLELQEAYNILSNEDSRAHYDKNGRGKADDISDIQARFGGLFGGAQGRFDEFIGEISIISEMGNAIRKGETGEKAEDEAARSQQNEAKRKARIETLSRNLASKLDSFDPAKPADFETSALQWLEDLKHESFGVELLHVIGEVYKLTSSASPYHPSTATSWTGSWLPSLKMKGLYITSTVSTVRKAYRVKSAFAKLDKTSKDDSSETAKNAGLEEEAAKAAIEAIWEGVRAEVIGVIADTCNKVLSPDPVTMQPKNEKQEIEGLATPLEESERRRIQQRCQALEKLGRIFEGVTKDPGQPNIFEQLAQGGQGNTR